MNWPLEVSCVIYICIFFLIIFSKYCRTSYSSVLIIVAFSMERYLAICHPLYSHTMSGFKRAVRIIVLVWFLAMLSAIPYALFTRLNYVDRPLGSGNFLHESAFCALLESNIYPQVCIATMAGILIFCRKIIIYFVS